MREKDKKVCRVLYFFEYFFMFVSAVSGCASVSAFASLVDAHAGTARIKNICINFRNQEVLVNYQDKEEKAQK